MTNRELARKVAKQGCRINRHGSSHDEYINPVTGGVAQISRAWTKQVPEGTLGKILKDLGLSRI